ncbi:MAG: hypothetical protein ABSE63_11645 [Thermoguttaceae bacterium]
MKRFIVIAAMAIILLGTFGILKADEPVKPSDIRSYTQGFMPQLGGAYRNPDAYLPYYPGYAPYWQTAPAYPYGYPAFAYPYGFYQQPNYCPGNQCYGPRAGRGVRGY